jgi:hypothetical protein
MSDKMGPREQQLRAMREARYGRSTAKTVSIEKLKAAVKKVAAKKPKKRKAKGGRARVTSVERAE